MGLASLPYFCTILMRISSYSSSSLFAFRSPTWRTLAPTSRRPPTRVFTSAALGTRLRTSQGTSMLLHLMKAPTWLRLGKNLRVLDVFAIVSKIVSSQRWRTQQLLHSSRSARAMVPTSIGPLRYFFVCFLVLDRDAGIY